MSDKMREEFEEWAKENYFDTDKILSFTGKSLDEGRYDNSSTQTAWQAWQASRAAVVVSLPDWSEYDTPRQAIDACECSLKHAGVEVTYD